MFQVQILKEPIATSSFYFKDINDINLDNRINTLPRRTLEI
jgi:hypothetical protein